MIEKDRYRMIEKVSSSKPLLSALDTRQWIKVVVYSLLLINFCHYVLNDLNQATHTYHSDWKWHDWTANFATTLDELGWFLLLILFELETYVFSDQALTRSRVMMNSVRIICYLAIGHTVFAFSEYIFDLANATKHVGVTLCSFAENGLSFTRNLEYWELDASNCESLSFGADFYMFAQGQVITDFAGMQTEVELACADVIEVIVWLCVLFLIEIRIRLLDRGITHGYLLSFAEATKYFLYGILWLISGYWVYMGHWIFAWDEALWILGFVAIGSNLSKWREELRINNVNGTP